MPHKKPEGILTGLMLRSSTFEISTLQADKIEYLLADAITLAITEEAMQMM